MKLDLITIKSDEWYTPREGVLPIIKYLKTGSTIWCPFDTKDSEYVKVLKEASFNVIHTHILDEQNGDFFNLDIECDYIISNPPFSLKGQVLSRLYSLGKPFMMLLPIGVFDTQLRFEMFKNNGVELLIFNKRIKFYNLFDKTKSSPPFLSWYICSKVLNEKIVFDYIEKEGK